MPDLRKLASDVLLVRYRQAALSDNPWPKMAAICLELLRRGDQKVALSAMRDESPTVREWAALMALDFAPVEAERTLEEMARQGEGTAKIVLYQWRGGLHRSLTMTDSEWGKRMKEFYAQGRHATVPRDAPASTATRSEGAPMNREQATACIRSSGLAHREERILPHLQPGLRMSTKRDADAAGARVSRFAGRGVLPRGMPWPTWDSTAYHRRWIQWTEARLVERGGSRQFFAQQIERHEAAIARNPTPLQFLGVVRLDEIAEHASLLGLPDRGVLSFFRDLVTSPAGFRPEARGGSRVLYAPGDDVVGVDDPLRDELDFVPSTLSFALQYSLPEDISEETGESDLRCYGNEEYARLHGELLGGEGDLLIHQLGGAPQEIQNGLFLECQLASNGHECGNPEAYRHPRAEELAPGRKDWRLLLQIDSDEDGPGWMWGDSGRLYFCIRSADLAERHFDRVWCVEQCC
jgi:uncharacterized protein YwqG